MVQPEKGGFIGPIKDYPEVFREGVPLLTGYRCNYTTFRGLLGTVFMWHNETVNIWSHLLGAIMFVILTFYVVDAYPNMEQRASFMYDLNNLDNSLELDQFLTLETQKCKTEFKDEDSSGFDKITL